MMFGISGLGFAMCPYEPRGERKKQYERYYLALYLLALADHQLLSYPLKVSEGDSPDFMLVWKSGETSGLEITRTTDEELQRAITRAEKGQPQDVIGISSHVYVGYEIEEKFSDFVRETVEKKAQEVSPL
jgi:hypothetical protein